MTVPHRHLPIIVGGCPRSGTSLVRRILDAHPRIHCGPEVKFFRDFYGDYFADPISHLRFTTTARSILPEADLLDLLGGAFVALHESAAARAGKPRWADKNPENVLYLKQWERLLGEGWLLIQIVRNPLDTLASIKEARFPLSIPASLDGRIALYRRYIEAGLDFGAAHPDRHFVLRYEQLVRSPSATLECLMQWLGEVFDPRQLTFNCPPHEAGLEDPKVVTTAMIHAASISRWRTILDPEEADQIWHATRDLWMRIDPNERFVASMRQDLDAAMG